MQIHSIHYMYTNNEPFHTEIEIDIGKVNTNKPLKLLFLTVSSSIQKSSILILDQSSYVQKQLISFLTKMYPYGNWFFLEIVNFTQSMDDMYEWMAIREIIRTGVTPLYILTYIYKSLSKRKSIIWMFRCSL